MPSFTHTLPDGTVEKRNSKSKNYTHVLVGYDHEKDQWAVLQWSESQQSAEKGKSNWKRYGWTRMQVHPVSSGEGAQILHEKLSDGTPVNVTVTDSRKGK